MMISDRKNNVLNVSDTALKNSAQCGDFFLMATIGSRFFYDYSI